MNDARAEYSTERATAGEYDRLLLPTIVLAMVVVMVRLASDSAWDLGDGALHYLQARHAPAHVHLFFDQWAKPLYVLLGTAFAQAGPVGLTVFNASIAALTSWSILRMVPGATSFLRWWVPIMLLGSIQYFKVVISGLTEPLFGLLSIACVHALLRQRHDLAMALLSLAPFTRPEYVAFAPFVLAWVLRARRWSSLPWLLLGPVCYFSMGWLLIRERIWFFMKDPYMGGKDYGTGPWDHFLTHASTILGEPLLWLALAALPVVGYLWKREVQRRERHLAIAMLAVLPALAIWVVHSYAYWAGGRASSGLIRVLSTAVSLTVLFVAHAFGSLLNAWRGTWQKRACAVLVCGYAFWAQDDLRYRLPLPQPVHNEQRQVVFAAGDARPYRDRGNKIVSMHPYFAAALGLDIWDTVRSSGFLARDWSVRGGGLREGDLVQWDPSYGPVESRFELRSLMQDSAFHLISVHFGGSSWGWDPFGVWLFERRDVHRQWLMDTVIDLRAGRGKDRVELRTTGMNNGIAAFADGNEFPVNVTDLRSCAAGSPLTEWRIQWNATPLNGADTTGLHWVFTEQIGDSLLRYSETEAAMRPAELRIPFGNELPGTMRKLYLWNEHKQPFSLMDLRIMRRCLQQTPKDS